MGQIVFELGAGARDEGAQAIFTQNSFSAGIDNVDPSDPPLNSRLHSWVPFDTTLLKYGHRLTVAPGASRTCYMRAHYDNNGSIGAALPLADPAVTATLDTSAVTPNIPALDPTSDTTIRNTFHYITFWPDIASSSTLADSFRSYHYTTPAHPEVSWLIAGLGGDTATVSFSGTDCYAAVCDPSIQSSATSQSAKQVLLAGAGRLQYAWAVWRGYDSTSTVEAALQVGMFGSAVDSAIVFTMVGGASATPYTASVDTSTTVDITAADYVNWRFKRTAGAATTGSILLGVGFVPDL